MTVTMKGAGRCPRCASRKVVRSEFPTELCGDFYARTLEVCGNCRAVWEPFDPADLLDHDDPSSSFREPCGNSAFRSDSPEQRDPETWTKLMDGLKQGDGRFYCHKGVPLDPAGEDGFAYPKHQPSKMRLCRGWLAMWGARMDKQIQAEREAPCPRC